MSKEEENIIIDKNTNKWTQRIASELRTYAYKSLGFAWMYGEDAHYYCSINWKINFIIGSCAAIAAILHSIELIFVESTGGPDRTAAYYILAVATILLNGTIAIIQAYQLACKFDIKMANSLEKASKFGSLFRKITNQFALLPIYRDDAATLLNHVSSRFDELDREKPFIRKHTYQHWLDHSKQITILEENEKIIFLPDEFEKYNMTDAEKNIQCLANLNIDPNIEGNHVIEVNENESKEKKQIPRNKKVDRFINDLKMF